MQFKFDFQLTDKRFNKFLHFTNFTVSGIADIGKLNHVLEIKIRKITYFKRGEFIGVDISELLQVIKPELYDEIFEATRQHVTKLLKQVA